MGSAGSFWRWFDGSQCVTDDGAPLALYHGTGDAFDVFDGAKSSDGGFHFGTLEAAHARLVARGLRRLARRQIGANIQKVYLRIRNPLRLDFDPVAPTAWRREIQSAKALGYDGIVYPNQIEAPVARHLPHDIREEAGSYPGGVRLVSASLGVLADLATREAAYAKAEYRIRNGCVSIPAESWVAFYPEQIHNAIASPVPLEALSLNPAASEDREADEDSLLAPSI